MKRSTLSSRRCNLRRQTRRICRCVPFGVARSVPAVHARPARERRTSLDVWQRAAREERLRKVMLAKRAAQLINGSSDGEAPSTAEVESEPGGMKRPNPDAGMPANVIGGYLRARMPHGKACRPIADTDVGSTPAEDAEGTDRKRKSKWGNKNTSSHALTIGANTRPHCQHARTHARSHTLPRVRRRLAVLEQVLLYCVAE